MICLKLDHHLQSSLWLCGLTIANRANIGQEEEEEAESVEVRPLERSAQVHAIFASDRHQVFELTIIWSNHNTLFSVYLMTWPI